MRCVSSSWVRALAGASMLGAMSAQAQNCPPVNFEEQKVREQECRAARGEWARFGVRDHLCGIYTCAERTRDGGKPCRHRADCEHLCVTERAPVLGAETVGHCTAVKTTFGCFTHVDGGRIVGRVCLD
jgi:hypothetical protein